MQRHVPISLGSMYVLSRLRLFCPLVGDVPLSLAATASTSTGYQLRWYTSSFKDSSLRKREVQRHLLVMHLDPSELEKHNTSAIRNAYLSLVKVHHPDGAQTDGSSKFTEIKHSYDALMKYYTKIESEQTSISDEKTDDTEVDIQHIAPQHRQYLSHEGLGYGNPFERRKQYDKYRADKAADHVFEFRKERYLRQTQSEDKALTTQGKDVKYARRTRTSNMLYRMVDDMIRESMENGDFDNLPGKGKPMKSGSDANPYIDTHTHRLNKVLINNGYAPEWMSLRSEIWSQYESAKTALTNSLKRNSTDSKEWKHDVAKFREEITSLNKRIDKLNLITPSLHVQMVHFNAQRGVELLLEKKDKRSLSSS